VSAKTLTDLNNKFYSELTKEKTINSKNIAAETVAF
jgi:hypothetical protein